MFFDFHFFARKKLVLLFQDIGTPYLFQPTLLRQFVSCKELLKFSWELHLAPLSKLTELFVMLIIIIVIAGCMWTVQRGSTTGKISTTIFYLEVERNQLLPEFLQTSWSADSGKSWFSHPNERSNASTHALDHRYRICVRKLRRIFSSKRTIQRIALPFVRGTKKFYQKSLQDAHVLAHVLRKKNKQPSIVWRAWPSKFCICRKKIVATSLAARIL